VILAIKAAAKMFAGDMIEGARKVQTEWLEALEPSHKDPQTNQDVSEPDGGPVWPGKEKRRGALKPEHLREAFRRHMLENVGGLVGELGLWQAQQSSGVERFGVKVGGKRLFK
jgi:transcription initiation factor TFIID subunit 11